MSAGTDSVGLGLQILAEDLQSGRVPANQRSQRVRAALDDGRACADSAAARWGRDPETIARACGVPVIDSDRTVGFGTTVVFGEYGTRPPQIVLYAAAIARLERQVAQSAEFAPCARDRIRAIFLAHELYHHFDCTDARGPIARRDPVTVLQLGRWRWTSGLRSLAEIAAGAFAQCLLDLPFHPAVLSLLLQRVSQELSTQRTQRIAKESI